MKAVVVALSPLLLELVETVLCDVRVVTVVGCDESVVTVVLVGCDERDVTVVPSVVSVVSVVGAGVVAAAQEHRTLPTMTVLSCEPSGLK